MRCNIQVHRKSAYGNQEHRETVYINPTCREKTYINPACGEAVYEEQRLRKQEDKEVKSRKYELSKFSLQEMEKLAKAGEKEFVIGKFFISIGIFLSALIIIGFLYELEFFWILLILFVGGMCILPFARYYYLQNLEKKKFNDVDVYLHQMAYSFKRNPKINIALEDTVKVLSGNMKLVVKEAICILECGQSEKVYQEALAVIEKEYRCPRIKTLHKFLISIEERGGSYGNSIEVLLTDYDRWVKRVYKYQHDIARVKKNSLIGVILSGGLATASILISSILKNSAQLELTIVKDVLYQIITTVFVIMNILYILVIQVQCNKDWLANGRTEENILKDYKMVFASKSRYVQRFEKIVAVLGTVVSLVVLISGNFIVAAFLLALTVYLAFIPRINKKNAFSRLKEDVYPAFSEWMRDVVINLHQGPLLSAIESTYDDCPAVMKNSLGKFIYDLNMTPSDVRPFYNFMKEFGILDVSSTVKTLYSVTEMEPDNMDRMLNALIRRNYEIVDKHEEIKYDDNLSMLKFSEYIPMVFVSLKLGVDMMLIISNYL